MPKAYSLDLRERVVGFVEDGQSRRAAAARFRVSVSLVVNLMKAVRTRGSFAPKPSGGRRHAKLEPHRAFLLAQVAEKADITMPELAGALAAAHGEKADPASLSRWLIGAGYRFKKNSAGERTRSPRHQASARGMDRSPPTADAACAAPAPLPGRDWSHHQDDAFARPLSQGAKASRQGAVRTLEDPNLHRRPALRRAHRAVRDRRAEGSAHLRNLCRDATGPDPQARRHRHLRQSAGPQKRGGRASHSRQRRLAPLSAALQS